MDDDNPYVPTNMPAIGDLFDMFTLATGTTTTTETTDNPQILETTVPGHMAPARGISNFEQIFVATAAARP